MKKPFLTIILSLLFLLPSCSTENKPIFTFTSNVNPSEAGSVSPASGEYDEGTDVEITANENENWVFSEWQGDLSGSQNPTTIQMNGDKSVTAFFEKREYSLTVNIEGEGAVHESLIQSKTTDYPHGSVVQLEADPAEGWEFIEWRGDLDGSQNPMSLTVNEEKNVTAVFDRQVFELSVTTEGSGTVSISPEKEDYGHGEEVELEAIAADGWYFSEWTGDVEDDENPLTITLNDDIGITAVFEEIEYQEVGESYQAADGLTVTLNSFDINEKSGSYEYIINYTLKNNTDDQEISEGTFKLFYLDDEGGEGQTGFFGTLFPGDDVTRSFTFEALKDVEFSLLAYHHEIFLAQSPPDDALIWEIPE